MNFEPPNNFKEQQEAQGFAVSKDKEKGIVEREQRSALRRNLGVSFQGEKGLEVISPETIEKQLEMMARSGIKFSQFHLSKVYDLKRTRNVIQSFREKHPDISISIHTSTPILSETGKVKNQETIREQLEVSQPGDIITIHAVHPNSLLQERHVGVDEQDTFYKLDKKQKDFLVEKTAEFFAEIIAGFVKQQRKVFFAVENVGQTIEEMEALLDKTRTTLIIDHGFDATEAEKNIRITLDVNHVLHSVKGKSKVEQVKAVDEWISKFQQDIRCFHISVPELTGKRQKGFQEKIRIFNELYNEYSLEVPVYLESKRSIETIGKALNLAKEVIEK